MGRGIKASLLGSASRTDGTGQVTYKGHRLYLFVKDKAPGQTKGQGIKGFGGQACTAGLATKPCVWYAVSPAGSAITTIAAPAPKTTAATKVSVSAGSPSEFKFEKGTYEYLCTVAGHAAGGMKGVLRVA